MVRLALVVSALLGLAAPAAGDLAKLDPRARIALQQLHDGVSPKRLVESRVAANAAGELDVFIVGSVRRTDLEAAGARVRAQAGEVFTAYVPPDAIERVAGLPGVRRVEGAAPVELEMNVSVPTTNATALRGVGPGFAGSNGAGVIVGDVDTGVDYEHGDFDDPAGNTRLIGIWDQTDAGGPTPIANGTGPYSYGSDWTSADIDGGVARESDDNGHGTHVIGIAGGDGSQTGGAVPAFTYVGMAPVADLVMVKTDLLTSSILDGVAYVFGRATALGQNAVVNLSLGSHFGPHDGTSAFESGLSALTAPGRIIVKSAGNERGVAQHAEVFAAGAGTNVTMSVTGSGSGRTVAIDGYYEASENVSVTITTPSPGSTTIGPIALGALNAAFPGQATSDGTVYLENGVSLTSTGDREIYVEINVGAGQNMNGTWTFTFTPVALGAANGEVDLWRFFFNTTTANFVTGNQSTEELISEPGNAVGLVTAAAYVTKTSWIDCDGSSVAYTAPPALGAIAPFSSPGPTRDGRQKPDIAAPGMGIGSGATAILQTCPVGASRLLDDLQHFLLEGTSMSAPHVTGAVALLLQHFGALTPAQVKAHLTASAIVDGNTGAVWNKDWGNGKLFLENLAVAVEPTGGAGAEFALRVGPNPTGGLLVVDFSVAREADVSVDVFDLMGRAVARLAAGSHAPGRYQARWDATRAPLGLYLVRYRGLGFSQVKRVVVTR